MPDHHYYYKIVPDGTISDGALLEILRHIDGCHVMRCAYDVENKILQSTPMTREPSHQEDDTVQRDYGWEREL